MSSEQQRQLSARIRRLFSGRHDQHTQHTIILTQICPLLSEIDDYFSPQVDHYQKKYTNYVIRHTKKEVQTDTKDIEKMKNKIEKLIKILHTFTQKLQIYRSMYKIKTRDEYTLFIKCTTNIQKHLTLLEKYLQKIHNIMKRLEPIQLPKRPPTLHRTTQYISSGKTQTSQPKTPSSPKTPPHGRVSAFSGNIYHNSIYNPYGLSKSS